MTGKADVGTAGVAAIINQHAKAGFGQQHPQRAVGCQTTPTARRDDEPGAIFPKHFIGQSDAADLCAEHRRSLDFRWWNGRAGRPVGQDEQRRRSAHPRISPLPWFLAPPWFSHAPKMAKPVYACAEFPGEIDELRSRDQEWHRG